MRLLNLDLAVFFLLAIFAGAAEARTGTTNTELGLRAAPSGNTELLLTMPVGSKVNVGACSRGWCKVTWNSYSGYARQSGLSISAAPESQARRPSANEAETTFIPVYPRYPYRAGYYPKADWYYDLPPYAAIVPSFYRKRFFMLAQERDRYRYMPHIFRGNLYGDGGPIEDIDLQKITGSLKETYGD